MDFKKAFESVSLNNALLSKRKICVSLVDFDPGLKHTKILM